MESKYEIVYADPPWSFYNDMSVSPNVTTVKGMRRPPYPVLSSDDIARIRVENIVAENAILFIWTTDYHLEKCVSKVIPAWGFEYKTIGFVWAKKNKNGSQVSFMGAYTKKSGCELCLIATRGKHAHGLVVKHNINSFIEAPRMGHSEKPAEVRNAIEQLCGERKRLELFARKKIKGWDSMGLELDGKDLRNL